MNISKNHIGRKISRLRELRDMKQEALAQALGMSQQTITPGFMFSITKASHRL